MLHKILPERKVMTSASSLCAGKCVLKLKAPNSIPYKSFVEGQRASSHPHLSCCCVATSSVQGWLRKVGSSTPELTLWEELGRSICRDVSTIRSNSRPWEVPKGALAPFTANTKTYLRPSLCQSFPTAERSVITVLLVPQQGEELLPFCLSL